MSKKSKKSVKKDAGGDDDDWEAILAAEAAVNGAAAAAGAASPAVQPSPAAVSTPSTVAADDEDDSEEDEPGDKKGDKKKKKKKTKGKKDEGAAAGGAAPISAAGKAILLRKQQIEAEEERLRQLRIEEERLIALQEAKEAAEQAAIEAEKEKRRKAKQDKVNRQKEAGTYMTKAEKEKARKQQERLEAMKASSSLLVPGSAPKPKAVDSGVSAAAPAPAPVPAPASVAVPVPVVSPVPVEEEVIPDVELQPEVDEDDWEALADDILDNADALAKKVSVVEISGEEEDGLEADKRKEEERLRALGLERARREEEKRLKKEEDERELAMIEQKARDEIVRREQSRKRRAERDTTALAMRTPDNLRSPISCIMGHVDTGKTKLLDKIRHTSVQEGEAGGITQQIGATQFSRDTLVTQTSRMQATSPFDIRLPGLLVIDTPGHESFTNLRNRGSSLCDIAILVIDLMHGLEPQTIESINMLRRKRTPFVVALNKVDRCYGWKPMPDAPFRESLASQDENCRMEFQTRAEQAILALNEKGLNAKLYWENDDLSHTVSLVPTSAITGEGVPDLLMNLITLTQDRLTEQLMYSERLQCTVLEVKAIDGLGLTVDAVLVNGTLREGDSIVVSTLEGPVVTTVRALLTPPPNREMRVKNEFVHHTELKGAIGVKIVAQDTARVIAGTPIMVVHPEDDIEELKEDCQSDLTKVMKSLEVDAKGVMVHASTLGALEALLQFLREDCKPTIPVSHISIGPIYKKDVMRANIMNEKGDPEFATILAFDVRVDAEAQAMAEELNVRIFTADIIYHLFDQFNVYNNGIQEARRAEAAALANFPVILKILPQHIFNKKDPIVVGVEVVDGTLRLNTLLCAPQLDLDIGRVTGIKNNGKDVTTAKKGMSVSIQITDDASRNVMYGRQFDHTNPLFSRLTKASIDALKAHFADDLTSEDRKLLFTLKKVFDIK